MSSSSSSTAAPPPPRLGNGSGDGIDEDEDEGRSSPPKKRKKQISKTTADASGSSCSTGAAVKKKQAISCDACRARKVKCHRDEPLPEGFDVKCSDVPPCIHCSTLGVACTYIYVPKKRGPPNQYLKRLQEQQKAAMADGGSVDWQSSSGPAGQRGGGAAPMNPHISDGEPSASPPPPAGSALSLSTFTFGQDVDASGGPSWRLSPPPSLEPAQTLFSVMQPRRFSSFSGVSASNDSKSSYHALTLPSIEPSPPVSPFAMPSGSSLRPTLPTRSASLSATCDHPLTSRPSLPSLLRSSDHESPTGDGGAGLNSIDLDSTTTYDAVMQSSGLRSSQVVQPPARESEGTMLSAERTASVAQWMEATSLLETPGGHQGSSGLPNAGGARGGSFDGALSDNGSPGASLQSEGVPRRHRIDDVLPREIGVYILSLFFDFVWVLTPCLHKHTFLADLDRRREETDPLFFALVMSTLASTLLQVPKVQIPIPADEVRALATKCFRASRAVSQHFYDPPNFTMCVIRCFDGTYHYIMGNRGENTTSFVEAVEIAFQLGLHNESTYAGFDPIETEMRRRVFFLLFVGDKSMACLLGRVITLRREDIHGVALPTEVDDACLTREGYLPQPTGKTPLISGFNLNTRTFALLSTVLESQRALRRLPKPIETSVVVGRLRDLGAMFATASAILSEIPPALRPTIKFESACNSPAAGWNETAMTQIHDFFSDPTAGQDNAKDAYEVVKGNLFVTMCWVRFVLVGYRDELLELSGALGTPSRTAAQRMTLELEGARESCEVIALDLLDALHSIPIQSLAVNGPSLVEKTRFVAATFLDTPASETDEARARISAYLFDFLTVLSEIEKNFAE